MKRDLFLSILAGILLILSFPNFSAVGARLPDGQGSAFGGNLWILAWFGFLPLFLAIQNKSKVKAFLLSYLTGIIFWLGTIYWLVHVTLVGMIIIVLYLALYFGIFGVITSSIVSRLSSLDLFFIPSLWVLLEYLRSYLLTGFGWALLGYSQYLNLPIIQIADITGVWGVSFLVMMGNVVIWQLISEVRGQKSEVRRKLFCLLSSVFCLLFVVVYGYCKLHQAPSTKHQASLTVTVIQGNIPQELKWDYAYANSIIDKYLTLTKEAAKDNPDLIIWPEAALPEAINMPREKIGLKIDTPLLVGAVTLENDKHFNSALLVSKEGEIIQRYDKLHLVPFGEYVPLKKLLGFLQTVVPIGDFGVGREYTIFKLPVTFSTLICFEDLFPELSREFTKRGANFLINITNDAWFKKTSAPYQHLSASVFRAIENRRPLVRAANTGISCFIDKNGKVLSLPIFREGIKTHQINIENNLSFWTRFGNIFILGCLLVVIFNFIKGRKK